MNIKSRNREGELQASINELEAREVELRRSTTEFQQQFTELQENNTDTINLNPEVRQEDDSSDTPINYHQNENEMDIQSELSSMTFDTRALFRCQQERGRSLCVK